MVVRSTMLALALSTLVASAAWADGPAGTMTLAEFRQHPRSAQIYMVLGALALSDTLDVACPQPVTVAEWQAALAYQPLALDTPWVTHLLALMDARGCTGQQAEQAVKPDA